MKGTNNSIFELPISLTLIYKNLWFNQSLFLKFKKKNLKTPHLQNLWFNQIFLKRGKKKSFHSYKTARASLILFAVDIWYFYLSAIWNPQPFDFLIFIDVFDRFCYLKTNRIMIEEVKKMFISISYPNYLEFKFSKSEDNGFFLKKI